MRERQPQPPLHELFHRLAPSLHIAVCKRSLTSLGAASVPAPLWAWHLPPSLPVNASEARLDMLYRSNPLSPGDPVTQQQIMLPSLTLVSARHWRFSWPQQSAVSGHPRLHQLRIIASSPSRPLLSAFFYPMLAQPSQPYQCTST